MHSKKQIVIFGAGKIGRSFIGQLFRNAAYEIVFVESEPRLVEQLNEKGSYRVIVRDSRNPENETETEVKILKAIHISDQDQIINELVDADIIATSVGREGLASLADILAAGINRRHKEYPSRPIDIIIAENIRNADSYLSGLLNRNPMFKVPEEYIGLIETSIGKMVPIMTSAQAGEDPLAVYAEPYNDLILDSKGFRNPVPDVEGLSPKENMKAWVDRKLFIHNMGHAALAYQAAYHYPGLTYTWEALKINELQSKTRDTMFQSAEILKELHPYEFTSVQLARHVKDLLERFSNKALGDTIYRVGCDLPRKLGRNDRLMVPILSGLGIDMPVELIAEAWIKGCSFSAKGENGFELDSDIAFRKKYGTDHIRILIEHCRLTSEEVSRFTAILNI